MESRYSADEVLDLSKLGRVAGMLVQQVEEQLWGNQPLGVEGLNDSLKLEQALQVCAAKAETVCSIAADEEA
ncbi:MAG: hypothetical protein JWN04_216 [Myxococcaceae bacterium]|nr:hypothetical protein [Myxococcaceae bacterium]